VKRIAFLIFLSSGFITSLAQGHQVIYKNDSLTIILMNSENSNKFISKSIRKHRTARYLSIKFKRGEWNLYAFHENNVMKATDNRGLESLPEAIDLLRDLRQLDLAGLGLNKLPLEINRFTNLTALDLSFNNLAKSQILCLDVLNTLSTLKIYGFADPTIVDDIKKFNPLIKIFISADDFRNEHSSRR
jgi:Leucine-rich repeat (LRR) protein